MGQIYASKGVFVNVGTGLKYGSTVYTYLKYSGGKVSKKQKDFIPDIQEILLTLTELVKQLVLNLTRIFCKI